MVNRMRATKGHSNNRRSHHALEEVRLSKCECGAYRRRHHACPECGKYRGNQVVDVVARAERDARREAKRLKDLEAMGMGGTAAPEESEESKNDSDKKDDK